MLLTARIEHHAISSSLSCLRQRRQGRMNRRGTTEVNQIDMTSKQSRLRQFLTSRSRLFLASGFTMSSLNLVRLGALGAILAGVAWIASSLLAAAIASGRSREVLGLASLDEALYVVAVAGTMGGIVGLHARQAPSYGRLGAAGFLATLTGTALLLLGLVLSFTMGNVFGRTLLDYMLGLGLWGALLGFMTLGAATLRLGALPRWCGVLLIICLPLAIALGDYGGGSVLGLLCLAVAYALLSQQDMSALLRTRKK
jgi:hypothetical protein